MCGVEVERMQLLCHKMGHATSRSQRTKEAREATSETPLHHTHTHTHTYIYIYTHTHAQTLVVGRE